MKKWVGTLLAVVVIMIPGSILTATEADCSWCGDDPCTRSSQCFGGCVCISPGGGEFGSCFDIKVELL